MNDTPLPILPSPSIIPEVTPFDMSDFVANDNSAYCLSLKQEVGYVGKVQRDWQEKGLNFKQLHHALNNHSERPVLRGDYWFYPINRDKMVCPSLLIYRMAEDVIALEKKNDANHLALFYLGYTLRQIECFGQAAVHLATCTKCDAAPLYGAAHA